MATSTEVHVKRNYFKEWTKDPALPIHLSGFLDLFGVSMIIPLIMGHCRDLGVSPAVTGMLGSCYGAMQLFTSPIIGRWSDVAGRRYTLMVCLFMSGLGYTMFSIATTVTIMFVARLPLGVFKHSQSIGKAYLADITNAGEHSAVLGHFNAASSIGFIVGPVIGGHIAERPGGFHIVSILAGAVFFINLGIIWLFVPKTSMSKESLKRNFSSATSLKKLQSDEISFNPNDFWKATSRINWDDLWDIYLIKFLLGASVIVFRSNFSLMLIQKYNTTPVVNGYIISVSGIVSALVGFLTGRIAKHYKSNAQLLLHIAILQVITLLCLSWSPSLLFFVISLVPLGLATTVGRVASTGLTLERGDKKEIGILTGFQQSCLSVARMLGPLIAGIAQEVTSSGPGYIGAIFAVIAVCIIIARPQDPSYRKKKQN